MRPPPGGPPPVGRGGPQRIPRPPGARRGHPAPWSHLTEAQRHLDLSRVRAVFHDPPRPRRPPADRLLGVRRASAVLIPLYEHAGELWVVLTRRAAHLRAHRSEVSFPGGRQHEGETLVDTALREAAEEIHLDPSDVEVVGELHHLATVASGSSIVPFAGVLDGRPRLVPDPGEVDAILHVRLSELLDPAIFREERWNLPPLDRPVYFFELEGDTLWGATAAVTVDLLTRLTGTRAEPGL